MHGASSLHEATASSTLAGAFSPSVVSPDVDVVLDAVDVVLDAVVLSSSPQPTAPKPRAQMAVRARMVGR
jgi:hypothetical protein